MWIRLDFSKLHEVVFVFEAAKINFLIYGSIMGGSFHPPSRIIRGGLGGPHLTSSYGASMRSTGGLGLYYDKLLIKLQIKTLPMTAKEDEMKSSSIREATTETLFTPKAAIFEMYDLLLWTSMAPFYKKWEVEIGDITCSVYLCSPLD